MRKIKKLIFIIILPILMTGCEATYDLNINGNDLSEVISAISYDHDNWSKKDEYDWSLKDEFNNYYNGPTPVLYDSPVESETHAEIEGVDYYHKELDETVTSLRLTYSYMFNNDNYKKSTAAKSVFPNFTVTDKNDIITIDTGKIFDGFYNHPQLDSVRITITTDNRVARHNADEYSEDTYTWRLNKANVNEDGVMLKNIVFGFEKSAFKIKVSKNTFIIILITLAISTIIAIIFARRRINNLNK